MQSTTVPSLPFPFFWRRGCFLRRGCALLSFLALTFVLPVVLTVATTVSAADPIDVVASPPFSVSAEALLKFAGPMPSPQWPAEILLDDTHYTFEEGGRHVVEFRRIFRLLSNTGSKSWRSVYAGYAPWLDDKPEIAARVVAPDGSIRLLEKSAVFDGPEPPISGDVVTDRRRVLAHLPAMEVGSVVEEVIRITHKRPYFRAGSMQRVGLSREVPSRRSRLTLDSPRNLPLRTHIAGFPQVKTHSSMGASKIFASARITINDVINNGQPRVIRSWDLQHLPPMDAPEKDTPSDHHRGASISFSTGVSWAAVASSYDAIVESKLSDANVRGLTNGVRRMTPLTSHHDRIVRADEVLQRMRMVVRYTGVELGEAAVIPKTPNETLVRGFGDCKDQAVVLVAALRSLGFDASVALLSLAPSIDVSPDLVGLGLFNHAIVHVAETEKSPAFWIDSTRPFATAGELPLEAQGRLALIARSHTTSLTTTPRSTSKDNHYSEVRSIHLADLGPAQASEVTRATGSLRSTLRGFFDGKTDAAMHKKFVEYSAAEYGARQVVSIDRPPVRSPFDAFLLQLELDGVQRFSIQNEGATLRLQPRMVWSFLPGSLRPENPMVPRSTPLAFREPHRAEIVFRVFLPPGFDWDGLPPPIRNRVGGATLERKIDLDASGALEVRFVVDTGDSDLSPLQYADFRRAIERFAVVGPATLKVVHRGKRAIDEGRTLVGLDVYRALIERWRDRALHHERFADQLLELGFGHAARIHAHRGTELEPRSAQAWSSLGWVLLHDELGRKLDAGFDRTGAIEAFRRAIALDPAAPQLQANLAVALEHGDSGVAFGIGADVHGAIDAYETRRAKTGEKDYDVNLMRAYFRTGRFDDIVTLAPKVKRSPASDSLYIGAIAALEGPLRAIERAEWLIEAPELRREAIEVAGDVLPLVGKYQEAAVLLRAAADGAHDPKSILSRVKVLEGSRGHEACAESSDVGDVQRAVHRWYRAFYRLGPAGDVEERIAKAGRANGSGMERVSHEAERSARIIDMLARRALPARLLLDAALCATRMEESTRHGVTVVTVRPKERTAGAMFPAPDHVWFFARGTSTRARPVTWRLVTMGETLTSDFGHEALRASQNGETATAIEWLDRALTTWKIDDDVPDNLQRDPLFSPPFVRVWGAASDRERQSAKFLRTAAALLIATGARAQSARPTLETARREFEGNENANVDDNRALHRKMVHSAIVESLALASLTPEDDGTRSGTRSATNAAKRKGDGRRYAHQLVSMYPNSLRAYALLNQALWTANDLDALKAEAIKRLDNDAMDLVAKQTLSTVELAQGEFNAATIRLRALARQVAPMRARWLNHLAWSALFRNDDDRDDETALDDAIAATSGKRPAADALQTLAAVYAEMGKTKEAVAALRRAVDARSSRGLVRGDYYVVGRVAEKYSLVDEARAAYLKVRPETKVPLDAFDAWKLAERRLAKLPKRAPRPEGFDRLASPTERSLLREVDRLRQASNAATERQSR